MHCIAENSNPSLNTYLDNCYRSNVRKTVDFSTNREDLLAAWKFGNAMAKKYGLKVNLIVASEGMFHAARLISEKKISVGAILGVSAPVDSPKTAMEWQMGHQAIVDFAENLLNTTGKTILLVEDLYVAATEFGFKYSIEDLHGYIFHINTIWSQTINQVRIDNKDLAERRRKESLLSARDSEYYREYGGRKIVFSSFGWWQDMLNETKTPLEDLKDFDSKHLEFIYGERDISIPVNKYTNMLGQYKTIRLSDVNHRCFDKFGAPSETAATIIADEYFRLVK